MVSNASDDLPEPLSPVITVRLLRGISTSMFLKLCWRAPCTEIRSSIIPVREKGRYSIVARLSCARKCSIKWDEVLHCPTCQGRLRRVHRNFAEKMLYVAMY